MSLTVALMNSTLRSVLRVATASSSTITSPARCQTRSVRTPAYEGHIHLSWVENGILALGSALVSLSNPRRGDMVAALGDTTSGPVLPRLRDRMLQSQEGRQILKDRPRVNTHTVDMNKLALLPEGSFGRAYVTWLERCGVTPDTREPVHYIDDPELAYVLQRYRECHDFYHCVCSLPVNVESELALKFFEFANLGLPVAGFSAAFGHLRLNPQKRARLFREFVPWAVKCGSTAQSLITVYWEKRWEQDVEEMKREFGIWDPPEARWSKPLSEAKAAAEKRAKEAQAQLALSS
ncbi:Ubiquinone biosynthesis protein COQ4, mitochondrial [Sparassis crispa]|uniref:4-hydroxy-3-methoxy-5-polyprenylbenzoate decarboxylase n=1 Tax=Sparassis crispa TaxID=139825 RepID=A0A401H0N5_9APHY|nr:Ubiquinone biosynthesis protein COQ4, mitochondrial [Sparassis crispa]GBE87949.1 Ubiquinone biosynthesis protein COQ4, mitochondrial [Sparassis crispa]